jgi:hypothetical protein
LIGRIESVVNLGQDRRWQPTARRQARSSDIDLSRLGPETEAAPARAAAQLRVERLPHLLGQFQTAPPDGFSFGAGWRG